MLFPLFLEFGILDCFDHSTGSVTDNALHGVLDDGSNNPLDLTDLVSIERVGYTCLY